MDKTAYFGYQNTVGIKAIGFDLDGTLYPGWRMYSSSLGMGLTHARFFAAFGSARRALRGEILTRMARASQPSEATLGTLEDLRSFQAGFLASKLGYDIEYAKTMIDRLCYIEVEKRFDRIQPYKDVIPCLESLKKTGLRLGVLSDLPPGGKLERMGVLHYFDTVMCSEDFGTLKPSPIPFRELAKQIGVLPEEMAYVGNKIEYDAKGAKALGMKTAILGIKPHPSADYMFTSWNNLRTWILSLG